MIFANSTSGSKFAKNAVFEPFLLPKSPQNPLSEPLWRHFGLLGTSWAALLTHWGRLLGLLALSCGASGATKPALWSPLAPAGLPKWTPAAQATEKLQNLMLFASISLSFLTRPAWFLLASKRPNFNKKSARLKCDKRPT